MAETSGDSSRGVSGILFRGIHDSFTTQGLPQKRAETSRIRPSPARACRHLRDSQISRRVIHEKPH